MARKLTPVEVGQARALKSVMSWANLARLYRMNRWTLMYQLMQEEDRNIKKAKMRETNRAAYHRKKAEGSLPNRRQAYKARYGLDWEHVAAVRQSIEEQAGLTE